MGTAVLLFFQKRYAMSAVLAAYACNPYLQMLDAPL